MFVQDEQLTQWDAALPSLRGPARLDCLLNLAWHLRQRDPVRARALAREACTLFSALPEAESRRLEARCMLIEGEAQWLAGDLTGARALADQAWIEFDEQQNALGCADAHWLRAWIETDRGNAAQGDVELAAAAACARRANDAARIDIFDAAAALFAAFCDLHRADADWGKRFDADAPGDNLAVAGWINDYLGTSAFQASDFARAISLFMRTYDAAIATGQVRRAINLATNIGNSFTSLNAHHAALEWMQRGLELARHTGWPMSMGLALMQTAETLRQLGQREAALELLQEALATLAPMSSSRAYAVALEYKGDLAIDTGDHETALDSFTRLEALGEALKQAEFKSSARRGQAHALSHLGRAQEALLAADAALVLAREQGDAYNQIAALKVLAEVHSQHGLPVPDDIDAPNAALHYLELALTSAATID
ncbi:MAG: GGDEF domain-containing protein, partial [Pseudomonadota bacterium]